MRPVASGRRRKPLAACCAALFALAAPEAFAAIWTVTDCGDASPPDPIIAGSLRDIVLNHAASGDTVDLSQVSCSIVSVVEAIPIAQHSLILQGPTRHIAIRPAYTGSRILAHSGTGTLSLFDIDIEQGQYYGSSVSPNPKGGCVYSAGNVLLEHANFSYCSAGCRYANAQPNINGLGGAIYTKGTLVAKYSTMTHNMVCGTTATGGAAYAGGDFSASYTTISRNSASKDGGMAAAAGATISNSTISGNLATDAIGGLGVGVGLAPNATLVMKDSTISGNYAARDAGLYSRVPSMIYSSTIAFNRNTHAASNSAGATFIPFFGSMTVGLYSTLISNNTIANNSVITSNDIAVAPSGTATVTFTGVDDLIRAPDPSVSMSSFQSSFSGVCPLLGPLRNNGGPTLTHALSSGSIAIDSGGDSLPYDQRGTGYPRKSGTFIDIGAYEVQQGDIIFNNGFEGCP